MKNILYAEFMKLKRSYITPAVLVSAVFIPIVIFINLKQPKEILNQDFYMNTLLNIDIFQIAVFNNIMTALVSGYIFSREYTDKSANVTYSYGYSRFKIDAGKFIVSVILIMLEQIINLAVISLLFIFKGYTIPGDVLILQCKVVAISSIISIVMMSVPALIGIWSKNIIAPVIYGAIQAVFSILIGSLGGIYVQIFPISLPVVPIYYYFVKDPIDYVALITSISLIVIFSISAFMVYIKKSDIN